LKAFAERNGGTPERLVVALLRDELLQVLEVAERLLRQLQRAAAARAHGRRPRRGAGDGAGATAHLRPRLLESKDRRIL
jgi:hypothetical protein